MAKETNPNLRRAATELFDGKRLPPKIKTRTGNQTPRDLADLVQIYRRAVQAGKLTRSEAITRLSARRSLATEFRKMALKNENKKAGRVAVGVAKRKLAQRRR